MRVVGVDKNGDEIAEVSVTELDTMFKEVRNNTIDEFVKALNDCDRYVTEQITHCLNGNIYSKNEVFVVDDIYEIAEQLKGNIYDK